MRPAKRVFLVVAVAPRPLPAQGPTLKATVPLVVAPTTVTDQAGHHVLGLTAADLLLFDNNVPRQIQVDELTSPIALVVATQSTQQAWAALDKIKKVGALIEPLVAGDRGEAAVLWYNQAVAVAQTFTSDPETLASLFSEMQGRRFWRKCYRGSLQSPRPARGTQRQSQDNYRHRRE